MSNIIKKVMFYDKNRQLVAVSVGFLLWSIFFFILSINFIKNRQLFNHFYIVLFIMSLVTFYSSSLWLFVTNIKDNLSSKSKRQIKDKRIRVNRYQVSRFLLILPIIMILVVFLDNLHDERGTYLSNIYYLLTYFYSISVFNKIVVFMITGSILFFIIAYFRSKKNWFWMLIATILVWFDIVLFYVCKIRMGKLKYDVFIVILYYYLYFLTEGTILGSKLNNDFRNVDRYKDVDKNICLYKFDLKNSLLYFIFLLIVLILVVSLLVFLCSVLINSNYHKSFFQTLLLLITLIGLVFLAIRTFPYYAVWKFSFYKKNERIYRVCEFENVATEIYTNLKISKEDKLGYHCLYIDYKNKKRKVYIPKCYPNIHKILY